MIGRRSVLALLSTAALAGPARAKGLSVAVIGAGMAGIAAASSLQRAGATVTLYEARNRIGGRVWTDRDWPGLPVDMGAGWIHGTKGNPLTQLAKEAHLPLYRTSYDSGLSFRDGAEVDDLPDPWDLISTAQAAAWEAAADLSLRAAIEGLSDWRSLPRAQRSALRAAILREVEMDVAADWDALSARHFDAGESFRGGDALILPGYDRLAHHAAQGLDIRLGARVLRVSATAQGARLDMADGAQVTADTVICTLPLGVLKSGAVTFDPPLSPARQTAVDRLGMGLLNKLWLRFDAPPPVPAVDWLSDLSVPDGSWPEWLNPGARSGLPLLLGLAGASAADTAEGLSDADTLAAATDRLRALFGSTFPAPVASKVSRWRADPLAGGSYSFLPTGSTPDDRRALGGADWDGQLILAGEATSPDHAATAHGAWLSGLDAAAMVAP